VRRQIHKMTTSWRSWGWKLGPASSLAVGGAIARLGDCALAQITPDTTLGAESSVVTPNVVINGLPSDRIDAGAIRGTNVFHSFREFNIDEGRGAYFTNPTGIQNILSRVTGGNPSEILGRLGVLGNANLFLVNPNGIIFGPNASLDVGGSFLASTASSLNFADGTQFSATAPQTPPLLTVSVPIGLQFGGTAGSIRSQSRATSRRDVSVPTGKTPNDIVSMGIASDDHVYVWYKDGTVSSGTSNDLYKHRGSYKYSLPTGKTPNDIVSMGIASDDHVYVWYKDGTVSSGTSDDLDNYRPLYKYSLPAGKTPNDIVSMDIASDDHVYVWYKDGTVSSGTSNNLDNYRAPYNYSFDLVVPSGNTLALVGGDVELKGGSLSFPGGRVELGGVSGSGTVGLQVDDNTLRLSYPAQVERANVSLTDGAQVNVRLEVGSGGSIAINAQNLDITGESKLQAGIEAYRGSVDSKAGDIEINATGAVNLTDGSLIASNVQPEATGNGGNIHITTGSLSLTNGSELFVSSQGQGNGGSVTIDARNTVVFDGGQRKSPNDRSNGAYSRVEPGAVGQGGNVNITTGSLSVTNGAVLTTSTFGQGDAGSVTINVRDTVAFDGEGLDSVSSSASSRVEPRAIGKGGSVNVKTGSLSLTNGAYLTTSTDGRGNAGSVTINARDTVAFDGQGPADSFPSGAYSRVLYEAKGQGGNVNVTAGSLSLTNGAVLSASTREQGQGGDLRVTTRQLVVRDGAEVTVSGRSGQAGNLTATADSIRLDQGKLTAVTGAGDGGNIGLQVQDLLLMSNNSLISAEALGTASGGNINIDTDFIVAVPSEDSDIIANAIRGNGGRVDITASGIFGIEFREQEMPESSDITASSEFGVDGVVEINTPDVDPNRGLVDLPAVPIDTEVVQACTPGGSQQQSEFVVTGRGGLPPSPNEALDSEAIQVDWVTLNPGGEDSSSPAVSTNPTAPAPAPIVEAQGWLIDPNGEVILTAQVPTVTPHSSWQNPAKCHGS
jgi:filamentous hemagglutinin family protein